ncbi:endoglucanase EG-1 precursor [Bombardia bombarda]|uniref:Glucanase n=1 Tax=Bombardia bombarda TaxID=252184 RepID=A0AA40C1R3_9PEZI|nr:endoglucanase EG-1 precursor [Bombardia bombarda]
MAARLILLSAILAASAVAQQIGKATPEVHPLLPTWECTLAGGCVEKSTSLVLDSEYRWTHTAEGTNCKANGLNPTICPDAKTCSSACVLEGANYTTSGISTNGSELTLHLFVNTSTSSSSPTLASPRVYLLANDSTYDMFSLLGKEFTFDVDVSHLPCGTNGALYFSEMSPTGGQSTLNPAGAAYGTGYCDAQCPTPAFINGEANIAASHGACCSEMDIWEANSRATAYTPHPCNVTSLYQCSKPLCERQGKYDSVCDKDGCDFNPHRVGQQAYYAPNSTAIDTNRTFTVVTQFLTTGTNGTGDGDLREIRRLYVQDGKLVENAQVQAQGIDRGNSLTDEFCAQEKRAFGGAVNAFAAQGGMRAMGDALARGMVLVFSVWADQGGSEMKWLDGTWPRGADPAKEPGTGRGPCKVGEGTVEDVQAGGLGVWVRFSNVKSGEIGSTYGVGKGRG